MPSTRFAVKPKADRDLDDYADFLAKEASLDVALGFFDAAYHTFALLATQPNMGWHAKVKYPGLEASASSELQGSNACLFSTDHSLMGWTSCESSTVR